MHVNRVLSIHASYACRERGACCTAGWPIPVEANTLGVLNAALAARRLTAPGSARWPIDTPPQAPAATPGLISHVDGHCVFHRSTGTNRCEIHRTLGHAALPLACQQFPRISVIDPRGVSVTLSHYCPTAADLLDADVPLRIEEHARPSAASLADSGLDVRDALPPLLRSDMLMDWESWWHFERQSVDAISRSASAAEGLARLTRAVKRLAPWRPGDGPLTSHVARAFADEGDLQATRTAQAAALVVCVRAAIPDDLRPAMPEPRPIAVPPDARRRFVAAHVFANWTVHLGHGLGTWLLSVRAADALVAHGFTVGQADLWLRHLVDPKMLADRLEGLAGF